MNELIITKGTTKYDPDFTTPTTKYTTESGIDSYTKLACHFECSTLSSGVPHNVVVY